MQLSHLAQRKPGQISGGQAQRVALARALVNRPRALLLDEPLGALDMRLRKQLQIELKRIQQDIGITFVHVTHDQEEAMSMADTIAVMNGGKIEQAGSATELYERPRTAFVANFLGVSNLIDAKVTGDKMITTHDGAQLHAPACAGMSGEVQVGVRPEKITLVPAGEPVPDGANVLRGKIVVAAFLGDLDPVRDPGRGRRGADRLRPERRRLRARRPRGRARRAAGLEARAHVRGGAWLRPAGGSSAGPARSRWPARS